MLSVINILCKVFFTAASIDRWDGRIQLLIRSTKKKLTNYKACLVLFQRQRFVLYLTTISMPYGGGGEMVIFSGNLRQSDPFC